MAQISAANCFKEICAKIFYLLEISLSEMIMLAECYRAFLKARRRLC